MCGGQPAAGQFPNQIVRGPRQGGFIKFYFYFNHHVNIVALSLTEKSKNLRTYSFLPFLIFTYDHCHILSGFSSFYANCRYRRSFLTFIV